MVSRSRKVLYFLLIAFILVFALYIFRKPILLGIGGYLIVDNELQQVNVIKVMQGGASAERVSYAIELYKQGYAPKLLFTGEEVELMGYNKPIPWPELAKEYALSKGVPSEAIIMGGATTGTYEEALNLKEIMQTNGYTSAIVISDPFHMRRVAMTFNKFVKNKSNTIELIYAPVPLERSEYVLNGWWRDEKSLVAVITEYLKLGLYFFKYFI